MVMNEWRYIIHSAMYGKELVVYTMLCMSKGMVLYSKKRVSAFQWWLQAYLWLLRFLFLTLVAPLLGIAIGLFGKTPSRGRKQRL